MQPPAPEPGEAGRVNARPILLAGQHFPPPPRQERSRKKRDALLQSALALFAERGYEETSIEEIAHQAGVAVGGFYQHFASKRQILLVSMDRLLQEASTLTLEARSADLPSIREGITRLLRQAFQVDRGYAGGLPRLARGGGAGWGITGAAKTDRSRDGPATASLFPRRCARCRARGQGSIASCWPGTRPAAPAARGNTFAGPRGRRGKPHQPDLSQPVHR